MGERKIKISDLSRELKVNRSTITLLYYEKAKRVELDVLDKLCKYFGCSLNELLEYKEE